NNASLQLTAASVRCAPASRRALSRLSQARGQHHGSGAVVTPGGWAAQVQDATHKRISAHPTSCHAYHPHISRSPATRPPRDSRPGAGYGGVFGVGPCAAILSLLLHDALII